MEYENALPPEIAEELRALYDAASFALVEQAQHGDYAGRFRTDDPALPGAEEEYRARFHSSPALAANPRLLQICEQYIAPLFLAGLALDVAAFELYAYRMEPGDYFRTHKDDYAGRAGFVYYLTRRWCWDWGGLLLAKRNGMTSAAIPAWNKLIVLDHRSDSPPHSVSMVMPWALEARAILVGMVK